METITEKVQGCKPNNDASFTETYQKHTECGYEYLYNLCHYDDRYSKPVEIYKGENAVYKFLEKMLKEVNYCKYQMSINFNQLLEMADEDEQNFQKATKCHICGKKYTAKDIRVRDHCHITGTFRGSAHQDCKLKLRIKPEEMKIPVIFHNLRAYDSHFIMQEIDKIAKKHTYMDKKGQKQQLDINVILNNMEKYMAFMLGKHLVFLGSFQFMNSSLDKLVSNLPNLNIQQKYLKMSNLHL